jgi:hypothetical protein
MGRAKAIPINCIFIEVMGFAELNPTCLDSEFLVAKSIAAMVPLAALVSVNDYRFLAGDARQVVNYLARRQDSFLVAIA